MRYSRWALTVIVLLYPPHPRFPSAWPGSVQSYFLVSFPCKWKTRNIFVCHCRHPLQEASTDASHGYQFYCEALFVHHHLPATGCTPPTSPTQQQTSAPLKTTTVSVPPPGAVPLPQPPLISLCAHRHRRIKLSSRLSCFHMCHACCARSIQTQETPHRKE